MIAFTVYGSPQTAGSKQSFVPLHRTTKQPFRRKNGGIVVATVDDNPKGKDWRKTVVKAAQEHYDGDLLHGALEVTMTFYRPRPQSHVCKGGLSKIGLANPYPTTRPDVLKLARCAEDALTGVLWSDDSIIVKEHLFKDWGEARMEIKVELLEFQSNLFAIRQEKRA